MTSKYPLCIIATVLIAFAFAIELAAQQQNASLQTATSDEVVAVPDGTGIPLVVEKSISSAIAKAGDSVQFRVASPVLVERFVLIQQGTAVSGTIVQVRPRGHFGRNGDINIAIKDIILPVGKIVSVRQTLESSERTHSKGKAAGEVGRVVVESVPFFGVTLPMMAVAKGLEKLGALSAFAPEPPLAPQPLASVWVHLP